MSKFKYFKIKNYYICADQTLEQAIETISHIWNAIQTEPSPWVNSQAEQIVYLEKWGNYCKMSNFSNNYKIFDIDRRVVTKYIPASQVKVQKEVDKLKMSSAIKHAPKIFNSCESEGWYEEEYIFGTELWPKKWDEVPVIYRKYIFNIIEHIINSGSIKKIDPIKYSTTNNEILCNMSSYSDDINIDLVEIIINFSNETLKKIKEYGINRNILLSCTHGDFKFSHIIISDSGEPRVIDWETYGERSLLFDFLNPLGPWLIHNIASIEANTIEDFKKLLCAFDASLSASNLIDEHKGYIEKNITLYCLVYYLERLKRILEVNHIIDNTVINNMIRAIEGFKKIDKLLNK